MDHREAWRSLIEPLIRQPVRRATLGAALFAVLFVGGAFALHRA